MGKGVKRVAVTGGAGNIAYSLLFRIANGDMLGKDQRIALHILEIPQALKALEGVKMELEDCAFPLLKNIVVTADAREAFDQIDYALLVGAKPRGPGMERSDLMRENGKIFIEQGKALNDAASPNAKILVVGNPCNTNCWIAMHHAPRIPKRNFHAMTRLDQNRAQSLLARRSGSDLTQVTNMTIWGNHSSTQVPDFVNARIGGNPAEQVIGDRTWLEGEFITTVQKRGAAIIAARGASSAASAANAAIDAMRSLVVPTPSGQWFSTAVCSDVNPYGVAEDLIFSFPCRSKEDGDYEIVSGVSIDPFLKERIAQTEKELKEEKEMVSHLLEGAEHV